LKEENSSCLNTLQIFENEMKTLTLKRETRNGSKKRKRVTVLQFTGPM
jgi:hypothetical protein